MSPELRLKQSHHGALASCCRCCRRACIPIYVHRGITPKPAIPSLSAVRQAGTETRINRRIGTSSWKRSPAYTRRTRRIRQATRRRRNLSTCKWLIPQVPDRRAHQVQRREVSRGSNIKQKVQGREEEVPQALTRLNALRYREAVHPYEDMPSPNRGNNQLFQKPSQAVTLALPAGRDGTSTLVTNCGRLK